MGIAPRALSWCMQRTLSLGLALLLLLPVGLAIVAAQPPDPTMDARYRGRFDHEFRLSLTEARFAEWRVGPDLHDCIALGASAPLIVRHLGIEARWFRNGTLEVAYASGSATSARSAGPAPLRMELGDVALPKGKDVAWVAVRLPEDGAALRDQVVLRVAGDVEGGTLLARVAGCTVE